MRNGILQTIQLVVSFEGIPAFIPSFPAYRTSKRSSSIGASFESNLAHGLSQRARANPSGRRARKTSTQKMLCIAWQAKVSRSSSREVRIWEPTFL